MARDLLQHITIHKSMQPDGNHPRVLRELAEVLTKPLSIIYQQTWLTGEVPVDWRLANTQEGPEGGSGELQACQPDLSAWEGYGTDHPECHYVAHVGQTGSRPRLTVAEAKGNIDLHITDESFVVC
ncbi:solute carrier family 12 member 2 [Limosa lapponica baueri]|uniref:Solute carrier family 12 member 2 n=1 Tax=Limosa lapponica baueri TaxID=1758121 RepID=A0A2I0UD63_LIMLA|nr:solute carrier family 12 member 2 [Limosa lapponica baueri]